MGSAPLDRRSGWIVLTDRIYLRFYQEQLVKKMHIYN